MRLVSSHIAVAVWPHLGQRKGMGNVSRIGFPFIAHPRSIERERGQRSETAPDVSQAPAPIVIGQRRGTIAAGEGECPKKNTYFRLFAKKFYAGSVRETACGQA